MRIVNIVENALFTGLPAAARAGVLALLLQKDRWILWLPVPLALGICLYFNRAAEPDPWMGACVLAVLLAGLWSAGGRGWRWLWVLPLVLVAAGFCAAQWRTHQVHTPLLSREAGPLMLQGRVSAVDATPKGLRLTLENPQMTQGHLRGADSALPRRLRVRLKAKDPTAPRAGDDVQIRAMLLPLSAPVLPGAFDFQRHAYFNGLGATGYAIGEVSVLRPVETGGRFFDNLRRTIRERMEAGMRDREMAELTAAFMIGETAGIAEPTWDIIRRAGIAHLMAISGFHITVVTGAFFFAIRALLALWPWAALHWPIKKISAGLAIGAAVFYLLLIGAPITAERAVIMAAVVMVAVMLDREPFSLRLAAFAAMVLLLLQPEALQGPSFQMSFAAVVALIAFYEGAARQWLVPENQRGFLQRMRLYLLASLATTVIATLATAPYTLYHFGQVPLLAGLAGNIVAVPVSSLITLPMAILAGFLMPLHLEALPLWIVEQSMRFIMATAKVVAAWPFAVFRMNAFAGGWLALFTLGGLWICIWQRRWRWLGLAPVGAAVLGIALTAPRPDIMLSDGGRLMGFRDDRGRIWLSTLRREKFVAEAWLQREGAAAGGKAAGDWRDAEQAGLMRCDARACLLPVKGAVVSIVQTPEAVAEDCDRADLFIAAEDKIDPTLCPHKKRHMIDRYDLLYRGAHAVYIDEGDGQGVRPVIRIENVAKDRGRRPWVPDEGRRKKPIPAAGQ